ncbi:MAG: hypothetical protein IJN98_06290 [Alistipes sp.]|nr:hypothetical protein [Alistipes sp.]
MATLKERCMEILREEGYLPTIDDDGDIKLKVQGLTYYVICDSDDDVYLRVWLPSFWSIENNEEFAKAHFVANKVNREYKVAKVTINKNNDNTHAQCEMFISPDDPQLKRILLRLFNLLSSVRSDFAEGMRGE